MQNDTKVLIGCIVIMILVLGVGAYIISQELQGATIGLCPLPFGSGALNAEVDELNQEGVNASLMTAGGVVYMVLPNDTLPVGWNC